MNGKRGKTRGSRLKHNIWDNNLGHIETYTQDTTYIKGGFNF